METDPDGDTCSYMLHQPSEATMWPSVVFAAHRSASRHHGTVLVMGWTPCFVLPRHTLKLSMAKFQACSSHLPRTTASVALGVFIAPPKSRNLGPPTSRDQRKLALWHGWVEPRLSEACVTISRSYEEGRGPNNTR